MNKPQPSEKIVILTSNLKANEIIGITQEKFGIIIAQYGGVPFYIQGILINCSQEKCKIGSYKSVNEEKRYQNYSDILKSWLKSDNSSMLWTLANQPESEWGFKEPLYNSKFYEGLNFETKQGKNYHDIDYEDISTYGFEGMTRSEFNSSMVKLFKTYNDSWLIKNQTFGNGKIDIVFTAIPNIHDGKLIDNSPCEEGRTYNESIKNDIDKNNNIKNYYWTGVRSGILSALLTLDENNCKTVIIPTIGQEKPTYSKILNIIANEYTFQNLKTVYII